MLNIKNQVRNFLQNHKSNLILFLVVIVLLVGFAWIRLSGDRIPTPSDITNIAKETVENTKKTAGNLFGGEFNINEEKFSVDPSKLKSGGPPKDGIPSIDNPEFESAVEAGKWLRNDDFVLGISHKGEIRAYPHRVLVWHEIVNDTIAKDPILITYCPLCFTGIAFERKVSLDDGSLVETEFGVSGKLYNSNLVMYNRTNDQIKTESFWTQVGGEAIIGDFTGQKLKKVVLDTVSWKDWVSRHPNTKVLSRNTGYVRNYDNDPYGDYYTRSGVFGALENEDDRLFEKAIVFGIEVAGKTKAYPEEELKKTPKLRDSFSGKEIEITRRDDGSVRFKNLTNGEEIVPEISFWFSWAAFHPETELYKSN